MGGVGVLLHFKSVVLDVVNRGQDDPLAILLDPGKRRFHPESNENSTMFYSRPVIPGPALQADKMRFSNPVSVSPARWKTHSTAERDGVQIPAPHCRDCSCCGILHTAPA